MPLRNWTIDLGEFQIVVRRFTEKGVLVDFLVALLAWDGENFVCVTRYDFSHGFPHRDVLDRRGGLLYKREFSESNYERIFTDAIHDCQKNFEEHARFFREN